MGFFDKFKEKEKVYICSRCRKNLTKNQLIEQYNKCFCGECARQIKLTHDRIEVAEKTVDEYISYNNLCLTQLFIENVKTRVKKILTEHLERAGNYYVFYWSEYPMGARHSKELTKIDSIWHIVQYDYDQNPSETRIPYPEINDENFVEYLVKFIIEEKIKPNVQNQNEPTKSPTFVCAQCKMVLPMKYMHKQGICVNCISGPHKNYIPKQLPKEQKEENCENMPGAKEVHKFPEESKSIYTQNDIICSCCSAKVQPVTVQKFYGQKICPNCYEGFQKITKAIEANIDPYTLPLTSEQKKERHIVVKGVFVDDVTYVKCKMQKQLFKELYEEELNRSISRDDIANSVYLFNCSEGTRIYFDKKYKIPYQQFWDDSEFAFHPSTCRGPSKKYPISFYEVELLAKLASDTLYEKYKGINEFNWQEYIK